MKKTYMLQKCLDQVMLFINFLPKVQLRDVRASTVQAACNNMTLCAELTHQNFLPDKKFLGPTDSYISLHFMFSSHLSNYRRTFIWNNVPSERKKLPTFENS